MYCVKSFQKADSLLWDVLKYYLKWEVVLDTNLSVSWNPD